MESISEEKLIIAFVGLPARGKSYISRKLAKFLNWIGFPTKVFSVGLYRRAFYGTHDYNFFDSDNKEFTATHEAVMMRAIDDLVDYVKTTGAIGIFDGTNTKPCIRRFVEEYNAKKMQGYRYNFIWIESICDLENTIENNIIKTKLKSPDYKDWNPEKAVNDFRERIRQYEKYYINLSEEVDGGLCSYIQLKNHSSEIITRNVNGYLPSKILSFLMNLYQSDRPIYMTRHGESLYNIKNQIGGDSELSESGKKYSHALANFIRKEQEALGGEKFTIYSSTLKRTLQTAEPIKELGRHIVLKCLDELNVGICDGLSYEDVQKFYPKDFEERSKDKLNYRYPRGESYRDLIERIEPIIYELERRDGPVIVIGHQATLRCLYGYFSIAPLEKIPTIEIPLHYVIKLTPEAYVFNESRYEIDPISGEVISNQKVERFEDQLNSIPLNSK
jgi:broad specificity phosphatase PhoE